MRLSPAALAALVWLGVWLAPLQAQAAPTRVWVSAAHGVDAPGCSAPTSPCRSFQYAHDQVAAAGEIDVLDPGGYGALTITKAITIANDGVGVAGVAVTASGAAITINAPAGVIVSLHGLTITGNNAGSQGVLFNTGGGITMQNCVIRDFFGDGFSLFPATAAVFNIQDTTITNVGNSGFGVQVAGTGKVTAVLTRVTVSNSSAGFVINGANGTGSLFATIDHSDAIANSFGVTVESGSGADPTKVMVFDSTIANNKQDGVFEDGALSTTYLARSAISGNTTAFAVLNSGVIDSFGDNYIAGNGNDGGTLPLVATK